MIGDVVRWSIIFFAFFIGFGLAFYSLLPSAGGVYLTPSALLWAVVGEYHMPESETDASAFMPSVRRMTRKPNLAPLHQPPACTNTVASRIWRRDHAAQPAVCLLDRLARLSAAGSCYSGVTRCSRKSSS